MPFTEATDKGLHLRLALTGPSGGGKTYTALMLATAIGDKVGVIDTEYKRALHYAGKFKFLHNPLDDYTVEGYVNAMKEAVDIGCDVLVIDSISHAWMGKDGVLEMVDRAKPRYGDNEWGAWSEGTPLQNRFVEALNRVNMKMHLIVTMRAKTKWTLEPGRNGKLAPRAVGLGMEQRKGMEFEYPWRISMNQGIEAKVDNAPVESFIGEEETKPGLSFFQPLIDWVKHTQDTGVEPPQASPEPASTEPAAMPVDTARAEYPPNGAHQGQDPLDDPNAAGAADLFRDTEPAANGQSMVDVLLDELNSAKDDKDNLDAWVKARNADIEALPETQAVLVKGKVNEARRKLTNGRRRSRSS